MFKAIINEDAYISILEPRHSSELYQLIEKNRSHLSQWLSFANEIKTEEDARIYIENQLNIFAKNKGLRCGIWYQDKLAGAIGLYDTDWDINKTEIAYWLGT